jgi:hypothetical protein
VDKDAVERLVAAQLASGILGIVLNPKDEFEEMATTSVLLYQLVLSEVRKQGAAPNPNVLSPMSSGTPAAD